MRLRHAHACIAQLVQRVRFGVLPLLFLLPAAVAGRLAHRARFAAAAHLAAFLVLHTLLEAALCHVLVDLRAAHLATAAHHVHGRLLAALEGAQDLVDDPIVDERLRTRERRAGTEGVRTCRSRWWPEH